MKKIEDMKKIEVMVTGLLVLIFLLTVVFGGEAAEKTFRLGWVVPKNPEHPYTVAAETFAESMLKKTNGQVKMDLFPGAQLGGDRDMFESIQMGNLDIGVISAPVIASFSKVLVGPDMPYIFNNDYDLAYKAETGPAGERLLKKLEEATGIRSLTFLFQPFRHFYTNKLLKSIDDMKGVKLRTMESPVHRDIFSALGFRPTPIPYPEIYTSMQTGTIDAFESDFIGAYITKSYEVCKSVTISGHFNNAFLLLMSKKAWGQLSTSERKAAQEAAMDAAKATFALTKRVNEKYLNLWKEKKPVHSIDIKVYKAAVKPVIEKYSAQIPEVKEFVEAVENLK